MNNSSTSPEAREYVVEYLACIYPDSVDIADIAEDSEYSVADLRAALDSAIASEFAILLISVRADIPIQYQATDSGVESGMAIYEARVDDSAIETDYSAAWLDQRADDFAPLLESIDDAIADSRLQYC